MKRSEMLDKIWTKVVSESTANETAMNKCERMLEVVEKAGMLPPKRYRYHDWHENGITYSQWTQLPSMVNEWDVEDQA